MSELREAFRRLLDGHRRIGSPVERHLRPGRPESEIEQRLTELGLEPSAEVIEYFALQDGVDDHSWQLDHGFSELYLVPFMRSAGLEETIGRYGVAREVSVDILRPEPRAKRDIPEAGYWARTWFPLFLGEVSYAADCRGGASSVVWAQDSHPGDPTAPIFSTVTELIDDIADQFRSGIVGWRDDWQAYERDDPAWMQRDAECRARATTIDPYETY